MPKRYKRRGGAGKLLLMILGLAGLGVGVWLFGKRSRQSDREHRTTQNGR